MESVNEIMRRTAKHRPPIQEHRVTQQGMVPQGQRPKQPLTRRPPVSEQTSHSGQPLSSGAPEPQPSRKHSQQTFYGDANKKGQRLIPKFPPLRAGANDQILHQSNNGRRSGSPRQEQQFSQEPPLPATHNELLAPSPYQREMSPPKVVRDFYGAYPPLPPADVQDEWEDGETTMLYGDWEAEVSSSGQRSPQTDPETTFAAHQIAAWSIARTVSHQPPGSTPVTRETPLPPARGTVSRSPLTRNLREERFTQPQPPAPQALPREAPHYQRITQPLNPRVIANMHQQASREAESYEQAQQLPPVPTSPIITQKSICSKCKGAGFLRTDVPYGHPNFGKPIACECKEAERREKRRLQLLELSDLGAFQNKNFENFIIHSSGIHPSVQRAYHEAWRFAENPSGWFVLIGPNGCGKTHLAAAIANKHLGDGAVVLFTVVPELLAHLRATFSPTSTEPYDQRFAKMREAELLVLDDLGSHQSSPWANEKLFQLLNYRYNSGYPTVITANMQGMTGLDERIRSRLTDSALVTTVELSGAIDFRPRNTRKEPRW
ncbi:MAG TPA: ATP-binding protein [Ktedonobacteraceae bacterium]|nr:ATP-binding protein [Ktedonobacteraceae bacterium]